MDPRLRRNELLNRKFVGDGMQRYDSLQKLYREKARVKVFFPEAEPYYAEPSLAEAVNMALHLRRPLLLEGEPGTGKTRLAHAVAYELGYPLLENYVRSTSRAKDLLYEFDALARLYDIQERTAFYRNIDPSGTHATPSIPNKSKYVQFGGLGKAIYLASNQLPSVVLIDEIDKADIDFPNDLLLELERFRFEIPELDKSIDAIGKYPPAQMRPWLPLVIITSNREKSLPAPFLRRCLFHNIRFPDRKSMEAIISKHRKKDITPLMTIALGRFYGLRDFSLRKPPSTSELIDWIELLEEDAKNNQLDIETLKNGPFSSLPKWECLIKLAVDQELIKAKEPA